jgi:hypothetical protein
MLLGMLFHVTHLVTASSYVNLVLFRHVRASGGVCQGVLAFQGLVSLWLRINAF